MLNEGKTSKYLKYAIGEIVLVVIGILIALQINNNNEANKARTKELHYLKNIKTDLLLNIENINNFIETILSKAIHFHKPNEDTQKAIGETLSESKNLKGYTDMDELFDDLSK